MLHRFAAGSVIALTVTVAAPLMSAHAGSCLNDPREVRLSQDSVIKLNEYLCRRDGDGQTQIRVQFQRLNVLGGGALLNGGKMPWAAKLYGDQPAIANNAPLAEYRNLLAKFGSTMQEKDEGDSGSVRIDISVKTPTTPVAAQDDTMPANAGEGAEINSFYMQPLADVPLVDETMAILTTQTFPPSLNMFYTTTSINDEQRSPLAAMTVWRYLTQSDLDDYPKRLARYNSLVADKQYGQRSSEPKGLEILKYLTAGGLPEKFLISSAEIDDGGACVAFDFAITAYSFVVNVAVIENVSSKPVNINDLLGKSGGGKELREFAGMKGSGEAAPLQAGANTLAPSQRLIVPLSIVLVPNKGTEPDKQLSDERYRQIQASRAGTLFQTKIPASLRGNPAGPDTFWVRKTRESFKAPSYPAVADYAFGPEWSLNGLLVDGEKILFDSVDPNFLEITAGSAAGSCPILYASQEDNATWFRHGKIIHQAQGSANRQSETVTFEGFWNRFRIAEEELERATISEVSLALEMKDGRSIVLKPDGKEGGVSFELYANEETELKFTLPENLAERDVVRSRLTVTGYYDRYPSLLLSRLGKIQELDGELGGSR